MAAKVGAARLVGKESPDFYPTPHWVTECLLREIKFTGPVWEPAAGRGDICHVLALHGLEYVASDLNDFGGDSSIKHGVDFFTEARRMKAAGEKYRDSITNPPYKYMTEWAVAMQDLVEEKFALLLPLRFLEGQTRKKALFDVYPPRWQVVLSDRPTMYPYGEITGGNSTIAFAWFVWEIGFKGRPETIWVEKPKYVLNLR